MSEQYVTKDTPVGTRVECVAPFDGNGHIVGKAGAVIYNDGEDCIVEFDEPFPRGHDGGYTGRDNRCWAFHANTRCLVVWEFVGESISDEAINALLLGGE